MLISYKDTSLKSPTLDFFSFPFQLASHRSTDKRWRARRKIFSPNNRDHNQPKTHKSTEDGEEKNLEVKREYSKSQKRKKSHIEWNINIEEAC